MKVAPERAARSAVSVGPHASTAHAECLCEGADLAPDPAQPENAQLLPRERSTCEGGPFAAAHALVGLRDAPEYGNHEAEG